MDVLTKRLISHDEAREALQRLINSHFRKEPHARASIPARPDYDDDLVMCAYVEQQRAKDEPAPKPFTRDWWKAGGDSEARDG